MQYRLGVDIGGTFTDFALFAADGGTLAIFKQLTTPDDPSRAVLEGISALLAREKIAIESVVDIVHGTTLVTNAIIERRGACTGMLTTEGFLDVLDMREEKRYDVFDLRITFPEPIVPRPLRREVRERIRYDGSVETGVDIDGALESVRELVEHHQIESLAIGFLHAYANPAHENAVRERVEAQFPQLAVTTSADVFGGRREYERFTTACMNAFTQPMFERYIERLQSGLAQLGFAGGFYVMSSSGGTLTPQTASRLPVRVVESGPAAGVQMSVFQGHALQLPDLLSFDMGGTTAKGALIRDGAAMKVYALEVARQHEFKAGSGLPLRTPVIDMIEIGAGGGSIAALDARGTIRVGPQSAGAVPGPACYGQGGEHATLTDANLVLGYLDPGYFLGGAMSLDIDASRAAIQREIADPLSVTLERAAFGIHDVISEDVARAFRIHASERGFDYRRSSMIAFGGSGPVHALSVARKLRIPRVVFPVAAGVMSALGLLASPLAFEVARTREAFLEDMSLAEFVECFAELETRAKAPLLAAGLDETQIRIVHHLDMRYHGQGHEIEVTLPEMQDLAAAYAQLAELFVAQYRRLYAFATLDSPLVATNWKVEAFGPAPGLQAGYRITAVGQSADAGKGAEKGRRPAWFADSGGWVETSVYDRYSLQPGASVGGPALLEERESTVIVGPRERVFVDAHYNLVAELDAVAAITEQKT
jgi:N-methylhydantoinase A